MGQTNVPGEAKQNIALSNGIRLLWENIEVSICLISMIVMTILTFTQVVFRYGFHHSFSWTEEISRFFIVWMTFGGSAYAFRKGAHIGVEALVQKFSPRGQFIMLIFSRVATIAFFIILGYFGMEHTMQQYANHQLAPSTRLPVAIPYAAVPIGSALVILRLIDQMIHELKTGVKEA